MPINGTKAIGDDQDWKREAEKEMASLRNDVEFLKRQLENVTNRRTND